MAEVVIVWLSNKIMNTVMISCGTTDKFNIHLQYSCGFFGGGGGLNFNFMSRWNSNSAFLLSIHNFTLIHSPSCSSEGENKTQNTNIQLHSSAVSLLLFSSLILFFSQRVLFFSHSHCFISSMHQAAIIQQWQA